MDNDIFKNEFLVESFENLASIEEDMTLYEKDPSNREILNKIYRTVHTMKGSASFLGFKNLQKLTHNVEYLLDELREDRLTLEAQMVDDLLKSFDICKGMLDEIEKNSTDENVNYEECNEAIQKWLSQDEDNISLQEATPEKEANQLSEKELEELDEIKNLIDDHYEKGGEKEKVVEKSESSNQISQAALESLQELAQDGSVDASVLEELVDAKEEDLAPFEKEESEAGESVAQQENISQAALDSLKELVSGGDLDEDILKELEGNVSSEKSEPVEAKDEEASQVVEPKVEKPVAIKVETIPDQAQGMNTSQVAESVVRVNVGVLDKIMNIVGELVLARNQILQYNNRHQSLEFNKLVQELNLITSELQTEVMSTRMQPVGNVLTKFERIVRDLARQNNKKIDLQLYGKDTELDKTLLEAIKDPLVHIVRNAADHGLETVEERVQAGKPEVGVISIKSYNESGQVTVEITDDGRGLNKEKILSKAIEKGVLDEAEALNLSEQQIFMLIFAPGFSTAEKVTNISGRGVGMDVVKTNIEKIGGSVSISSDLGKGTTFKLRIPLTLAIVPALLCNSMEETFAIPQINLVELVRLETQEELKSLEKIQESLFLRLRGNLTPVFELNETLKLKDVREEKFRFNHLEDKEYKKDSSVNIVILNAENNYFGVIVDEILGTEEIVVKPLNSALKNLGIFGGTTIMGDGQIALILDALGYLNKFSKLRDKDLSRALETDNKDELSLHDLQENLLFKLFEEQIYAFPLSIVNRLEEFDIKNVEKTGAQYIMRYLDNPMPLIDIEKTIGLQETHILERFKSEGIEKFSCIVILLRGRLYGMVVKHILDISIDNLDIDTSVVDRNGVLGTLFINDNAVCLLDAYGIVEEQTFSKRNKDNVTSIKQNDNQKKILLVDDSVVYRRMEGEYLKELGYKVIMGHHGEDGLKLLDEYEFDLIVTDIEMPLCNGYEFASKVRANSKYDKIPIIALSTRTSEEDRAKGKKAGFDFHLEKFKKEEVLTAINQALGE
jgi:two-component system chemotaxis sensor kinase CheA